MKEGRGNSVKWLIAGMREEFVEDFVQWMKKKWHKSRRAF